MNVQDRQEETALEEAWAEGIPDDQWRIYRTVIEAFREDGVAFALGGAFALATYSQHWRNTKDLDLFIHPDDRERAIATMTRVGLSDYYEREGYDRSWIYRGYCEGTIVDVIWAMPNHRAAVDEQWLKGGPAIMLRDQPVKVVPPEEIIWAKLYVMQRPRCDWPDVVNVVYGAGPSLDWRHLIDRLGSDLPLLTGAMSLFTWLCPGRSAALPAWIWDALGLKMPPSGPDYDEHRINLIETRPWFAPLIERTAG